MMLPADPKGKPGQAAPILRLLSRGEAILLTGMMVSMACLFFAWPIRLEAALPAPALVVNLTRTGAAIPEVRWVITIGAIGSGLLLVVNVTRQVRAPLAALHILGGLCCFVTALTHFGIYPGPLLGLVGGALLTYGAVERLDLSSVRKD